MKVSPSTSAALVPGENFSNFIICYLLDAKMKIQVTVDGRKHEGYVHQLDFGKEGLQAFARVMFLDLDDEPGGTSVRVAIGRDGQVTVLEHQDEED